MRDARGPGFNRLGVKGSLSAINSLIARSVILFEALAERIAAKDERRKRIHFRFTAQARTAGAVRARKPATAPMPTANTGVYGRFIYLFSSPFFFLQGRRHSDLFNVYQMFLLIQRIRYLDIRRSIAVQARCAATTVSRMLSVIGRDDLGVIPAVT